MSLKKILFTAILVSLPLLSLAENKNVPNKGKIESVEKTADLKKEKISILAKGMVCGFCAQGIEKKFKALGDIEKINVSLETKKIDLDLIEGKVITDDQIKTILTESGYEVVKIERTK